MDDARTSDSNSPSRWDDWSLVCLTLTLLLVWALYYLLWALWYGLPTPWGVIHLDLFPPAIRKVS